ncbi:unnamed protein product [Effrenium voratum]|uniref:Uncharacterized protein n=1 Tax=Effrenium voratum TaxID=2562239 RepID=A0AA36HP29_9DINO|nr:unnamed protein product [Effrenium voratum]CAJ1424156.1 unnamed protein product [Effrenium voratum]
MFWLYLWSGAAGGSVPIGSVIVTQLNRHVPRGEVAYHSAYVTSLTTSIACLLMLPAALASKAPWSWPSKWYAPLGGAFMMADFLIVPAFRVLGIQVVLVAMLLGMLFTGMIFDCREGLLKYTEYRRLCGFLVVMVAVAINYAALPGESDAAAHFGASSVAYLLISFGVGCGYALLAKCNNQLSKDLGTSMRASAFSAAVTVACRIPLMIWIHSSRGLLPTFHSDDWYWFLGSALQNAFYILSTAKLPGLLGYSVNNVVMLVGKLCCSALVDALGWSGHKVPVDLVRALSMVMVFVGVVMFSVKSFRDLFADNSPNEDFIVPEKAGFEERSLIDSTNFVSSGHFTNNNVADLDTEAESDVDTESLSSQ